MKKFAVKAALKYTAGSAAHWSRALGGTLESTIKNATKPDLYVLPYIDTKNLRDHMLKFKEITMTHLGVSDMQTVPVQASMDATAVTGRMSSRKSNDDDWRLLYGVATHLPFQSHQIYLSKSDANHHTVINESTISIASLESCPGLLENGEIRKRTYYMVIILLPLVENPKPYCIGM